MNSKNVSGFTLIEVMFSLAIFSVILASVPKLFVSQIEYNTKSQIRSGAVAAANRTLDVLRLVSPTSLPRSGGSAPQIMNVDERDYSVVTYYCDKPSFCTSLNNRHLRVEVSYKNEVVYDVETVFTALR